MAQCSRAAVLTEQEKSAPDTQGKTARGLERSGQTSRKLRTLAGRTCMGPSWGVWPHLGL